MILLEQGQTKSVILTLSESVTYFYVYVHFNAINGLPFYIGKGHGRRANSINKRNQYWYNIVNKYGFNVELIEEGLTEDKAYELEIYWISQFKAWGFKLANMTDGGEGVTKGSKLTEEHKAKISKSLIGNKRTLGYKHSEEFKNNLSLRNKGKRPVNCDKPITDETRLKMSIAGKGRPKSDTTKLKMSLASKGRPKSEEAKINMRKPKSEEHKKKLSEAAKNRKRK